MGSWEQWIMMDDVEGLVLGRRRWRKILKGGQLTSSTASSKATKDPVHWMTILIALIVMMIWWRKSTTYPIHGIAMSRDWSVVYWLRIPSRGKKCLIITVARTISGYSAVLQLDFNWPRMSKLVNPLSGKNCPACDCSCGEVCVRYSQGPAADNSTNTQYFAPHYTRRTYSTNSIVLLSHFYDCIA